MNSHCIRGPSSGIGRETAVKLAKEGFQVIVSARREELMELEWENHFPMSKFQGRS